MPLIIRSFASTPWTRSLNRTKMLVNVFVTLANAAGAVSTMNGATVFVGGIVITTVAIADVPCAPLAPNATAWSRLVPKGAFQRRLYGGLTSSPMLDPFARKSTLVTPSIALAYALTVRLIGPSTTVPVGGATIAAYGVWAVSYSVTDTGRVTRRAPR